MVYQFFHQSKDLGQKYSQQLKTETYKDQDKCYTQENITLKG